MLAATRTRPRVMPASPGRARTGRAARSPRRARALASTSERPPACHDRRRRLARPLGRELAARRAHLLAAVAVAPWSRSRRPRSVSANASMRSSGVARHGVCATSFIGMRFTWARRPRRSATRAVASSYVSFTPVDHHVLVAHAAARRRLVLGRGIHDRRDRPAAVERHEDVAERIARGVERDRERVLRRDVRQPPDPRHDARRGERDVARAEPEPARVRDRLGRGEHAVQVEERLAHPHEDDVREPPAAGGEPSRGGPDLVDDLGRLQVALQAELAGRAERAPDRAARPGSRCTACRARDGRPAPGSA